MPYGLCIKISFIGTCQDMPNFLNKLAAINRKSLTLSAQIPQNS
jgi:hypothetical protein